MFIDRADAGAQLAAKLQAFASRPQTLVLALPRGGVPVGYAIAKELRLQLDVMVVRKLGAPNQPELAMGAIGQAAGQHSLIVMNEEVSKYFADRPDVVEAVTQRERRELQRRRLAYRGSLPPLELNDRTVILVDDGAATGASMRAAVQALRSFNVKHIVVALPVCSLEAANLLRNEAEEFVCLETPRLFHAVGEWYENFRQTSDDEVKGLLADNARAPHP